MERLLDKINTPADLKGLTIPQLKQLAAEIRQEIIAVVLANGGHFASNLGVVELTIALHRVFDMPKDKLVWDVGHQAYTHKLLTGRRESFASLRQYGGLSGFTDPAESLYDLFGAGHSSTAVSAALGMATARDLAGENYHVVAIIGDGALTGGMALEALNQAGQLDTRLIVILNDNGMAISPSVGALSKSLNKLRLDYRYYRLKRGMGHALTRLPLGDRAWQMSKKVKDSFKSLFVPTMIWEELGFTYMGPVDGHNIAELEEALHYVKSYPGKLTFLHVITQKGKGYPPAEENATQFHSVAPDGGKNIALSYSAVLGKTLVRIAEENPKVIAITAGMLDGTGLSLMAREFPNRVFDLGLCEQHAVTFAAGMATQGFIPVVAIYSTFLQRAFDQVLHDVCLQNLPVIFALDRAGIVGEDGKTHHGTFDLSYLGCLPNIVLCSPKDENELQHLIYTAVRAKRLMAIRYPRGIGSGARLAPELQEIPIGKGEILREGKDIAILALGTAVAPSLEAAQRLAEQGLECTVINARFVKPLDAELISHLTRSVEGLVTVEENTLAGGFGAAVLEFLQTEQIYNTRVKCLGLANGIVEHGSQRILRSKYKLDAEGIAEQVLAFFPKHTLVREDTGIFSSL